MPQITAKEPSRETLLLMKEPVPRMTEMTASASMDRPDRCLLDDAMDSHAIVTFRAQASM